MRGEGIKMVPNDEIVPKQEKEKRFPITVMKIECLGGDRYKVKIKETDVNLGTMRHENEEYVTLHRYRRGRYIMRKVAK